LAIPGGRCEGIAVENVGCDPVDDNSEESKHAEDFVHRTLADEPLLEDVGHTVEGCSCETEEVALKHSWGTATVGTGDVVGCKEDTHAAAADEDSSYLGPLVADTKDEEGDDYNTDNGPEIEELGLLEVSSGQVRKDQKQRSSLLGYSYGQEVGVSVRQHCEIVPLYIHETQDDIFPAINEEKLEILLEPISIDCVGGVNKCE